MFELSAVAIIAGSMFGQPSINSRPLAPLGAPTAPPAAPAQPVAGAPAAAAPAPAPAPVAAPAPRESDIQVVRPTELGTRPTTRVAAFWFIIPGR